MASKVAREAPYSSQRRALQLSGAALLAMTFQSLGIIYSDIGTSPLYVLNGIWSSSGPVPSREDIIGGVSAIIWSLTLVPLVKYVLIVLRFGTEEGEGGTFALYHGLFPPDTRDDDDDRALTGDSAMMLASSTKSSAEALSGWKWFLLPWALFGTSLTIADGVLTPAVSVTSAVGGIAIAKPSVINNITGISIAFLVFLFGIQRFGTRRLSLAFAPVTFIWLLLLGTTGIYNITTYPGILRAFDPSRMVMWFVRTKNYDYLAGVLLAVTGCEAMFANLGHFNRLSIQLGFSLFVYPMLALAYLGQGARLIQDGESVITNVFYTTIPGPTGGALYWIVYVFGILATNGFPSSLILNHLFQQLIASQAIITASFSLCQQLINLRSLPPLQMTYTSETVQGQVYFPVVNYALAIATIAMVGAFKNLANLTNAYGFSVSAVMFVTTSIVAVQMRYTKHLPWVVPIAFFCVFGFFDGLFFGASLKKIPHGAWVTLMIGLVVMIFMLFWTWGKGLEDGFDGRNRRNLGAFLGVETSSGSAGEKQARQRVGEMRSKGATTLTYVGDSDIIHSKGHNGELSDDDVADIKSASSMYLMGEDDAHPRMPLARLPTCAVFHKLTAGRGVPHTFYGFLRQWPALPRVVIFLSVKTMNINHVPMEDRYAVTKVRTLQGFYGVTYALGFRDDFLMDTNAIIERICALESRRGANDEADAMTTITEIRTVAKQSTHIVPHYHVVSLPVTGYGRLNGIASSIRSILIDGLYRRLETMFPETGNWKGSADEIIRVGINADI
ncbi:hypothetical protein FRB94_002992 [Tulasnella sp. JGI-2019a]|nr:hypothetical protein FRB93_004019 [Tulasnella sp. JGI-2019a]KAG9003669.1 hypothetical protein FRB94_002992 [Tulasnella sp. JGI-2019a]